MPGLKANLFAACDKLAASDPGYDQNQRWASYRDGKIVARGEVDCSSSCGIIAKVAGYPVDLSGTFYTGNFKSKMVAAGFTAIPFKRLSQVRAGDFLVGPGHVIFARSENRWWSAEVDERGRSSGGKAGNQGDHVGFRKPYLRSRGWQWILRPPADPKPKAVRRPPTLRIGSTGSWVSYIQRRMLRVKISGRYDRATAARVKIYQASHRLTPDGIVGPKTWARLGVSI